MQQQSNQRQSLEERLAKLEYQQRVIQRRIIQTQVRLELLTQQERNQQRNQQPIANQQINIDSPDNEDTSNTGSNHDSNESTSENDDNNSNVSNADSEESEPFRLPDGSPIYAGDSVIITNPSNINEAGGIVIGATPKRLKIKLSNEQIILRQPENLERA